MAGGKMKLIGLCVTESIWSISTNKSCHVKTTKWWQAIKGQEQLAIKGIKAKVAHESGEAT